MAVCSLSMVRLVPTPRIRPSRPATTYAAKPTTSELMLGRPQVTYLPSRAAATQITIVAGTQVGAVAGSVPSARVASSSGRQRFTTKYSATMIPAIGGNATPSTIRKSVNLSRIPPAASTLPRMPTTSVTTARLTCRPKTVPMKFTTPRPELCRFQSLILIVPRMITSEPTQPTDEVTIVITFADPTAWASSTPTRPMTYSPR